MITALPYKKGACCAGQDVYDAQIVAETIGIKHYVLNYESIFKEAVMEDFADSYMRGETQYHVCVAIKELNLQIFLKLQKI